MIHFYPKIPTGAQISTQRPTLFSSNKSVINYFQSPLGSGHFQVNEFLTSGLEFHSLPEQTGPSVMCPTTDARLTADPGVANSIPSRSHSFVEIDHKMFFTIILLPATVSFKKGCCQLQAKVCTRITG